MHVSSKWFSECVFVCGGGGGGRGLLLLWACNRITGTHCILLPLVESTCSACCTRRGQCSAVFWLHGHGLGYNVRLFVLKLPHTHSWCRVPWLTQVAVKRIFECCKQNMAKCCCVLLSSCWCVLLLAKKKTECSICLTPRILRSGYTSFFFC